MATSTPRLLLQKPNPDPVTGDFVDISVLNANFDKLDAGIGAAPVTAATRPASPFHGQIIRETDTRRGYLWNATQSAWDQFPTAGSRFRTAFDVERDTIGQTFYNGYIIGEANPRFSVRGDGRLMWGPGSAGVDTLLYRESSSQLRTDWGFSADHYRINGNTAYVMTFSAEAALSGAMDLPTANTDVPGTTISFTTRKAGAICICHYGFDFLTRQSSAGTAVGRIWIAGTSYADSQAIFNGGNTTAGTRATVGNSKRVTLGAAGSYQVKLQANGTIAGGPAAGIQAQAAHTKVLVEVFE